MENQVSFDVALIVSGSVTILFGLVVAIASFFFRSWKKEVDVDRIDNQKEHQRMEKESTSCKVGIANNYLQKKNFDAQVDKCTEIQTRIFTRIEEFGKELREQTLLILKEVKNGNNKK